MKRKLSLYITDFLASRDALAVTLFVGILFLWTNYQSVVYLVNPENKEAFSYPYWLRVVLSHIDALFFALTTGVLMFQARDVWQKRMFCTMEAIMVMINLNRQHFEGLEVALSVYLAIFSGLAFYFLGSLAVSYLKEDKAKQARDRERLDNNKAAKVYQAAKNANNDSGNKIGFRSKKATVPTNPNGRNPISDEKVTEIKDCLSNGFSVRETADICGVSKTTVGKYAKSAFGVS